MKKRAHIIYSGRVQGVGFRYTAVDQAGRYPVTGWVKNLPGEKVELVVEGEEEAIDQYTSALSRIFKQRIQKEDFFWEPATGEFTGFQINY
ncbi:hypothetical protein A3K48_05915 [candidate division WOR-1 bacterium RIFOXYA12_FULL_52_29]|uniref:acylphosphatase n=1 Tax=candidate division WOR-1 bacterium RIFOXYC12_FULL_54_18 TaxID=1802584 RepID=A0A1F4T6Y5_UNCSA|nr:MAG: hypothetical protein A3K44_05915 [candidate division WOR-1 bacterium RIFOXYA2_FULL_51_19]OGC18068.1 MAG: hypothetical protein A3K48_05915 [candidate division WOR-1 bacterium RIFOXYA12_FULL_52_29]OGC26924.1 MAG: hypothetical protein A3K32_05910 [candidate division WOR-1 bacterium RIFOXYB2_FULL_45_9]OGC28485.1 MAG: hypothetical protein A3K49_05915 [candidate division WOR-1 bacterium RIFOXYC12_FULL_54_18]OGC31060.1 MAG: hypothetical protein A2346_06705 [candidate division WOR-1 bacterium R